MHNEFPIPKLPPPQQLQLLPEAQVSPLPSSPLESSSQENKDEKPTEPSEANPIPKQLEDMLAGIISHLLEFTTHPPHTVQRLADLILQPRAHYRALASYLHAVDRVVQVTSGTNTYPLPLSVPDMSGMHLNGEEINDPAASVAWGNPTTAALGTDEALGGALLTPIPWLTRRSPEGNGDNTPGAQIHSEATETIDGPNGMGSIETVSVSVNGIPSTGHARAITQGELLRQEQRAGVVPVSQLSRQEHMHDEALDEEDEEAPEEEEETPHARGPEEIGVNDTGPQSVTTSHMGEGGLGMQGIDVEAAVGRPHEDLEHRTEEGEDGERRARSPSAESTGTKREAEQPLEGEPAKKIKEDDETPKEREVEEDGDSATKTIEGAEVVDRTRESKPEEDGERMDTGK